MNDLQNSLHLDMQSSVSLSSTSAHIPADVLDDANLSDAKKRELLASWASDANAVLDDPTLRQLPSGSCVKVDEILRSLKALDTRIGLIRHKQIGRQGPKHWGVNDDDDDPPPCPAYVSVPPKGRGGAGFSLAELVAA